MTENSVGQGVAHACCHDGFHDLGTFDEALGTVQSPGVRADAQCCKMSFREGGRHGAPLPPGLATLRVSSRRQLHICVHHAHDRVCYTSKLIVLMTCVREYI